MHADVGILIRGISRREKCGEQFMSIQPSLLPQGIDKHVRPTVHQAEEARPLVFNYPEKLLLIGHANHPNFQEGFESRKMQS